MINIRSSGLKTCRLHMVPTARSVIVFGTEIPVYVYELPPREKTRNMLRIAESLDHIAARLADNLIAENFPSAVVPMILPLMVESGRVQGVVRLKTIAARGGLGAIAKGSFLISPRYGTRLVLLGVVTEMDAARFKTPLATDFCRGCDQCIRSCPGGAISPDGVDAFRCRNISQWIPASLVPAATWLLSHESIQRLATPFAYHIARHATMWCSLCATVCPCFHAVEVMKDEKRL